MQQIEMLLESCNISKANSRQPAAAIEMMSSSDDDDDHDDDS